MLTPTHAKKSFTANRVFTGRGDERDLFSAAIGEADTQESYKVLMWYGVGGQGKSALLREFGRMTKTFNEAEAEKKSGKKLIPAKIDFDDERLKRIDAALYSIRLQLAQTSGFSFHTFDTAFIAYYKKTRPGIDIATAFPELFKGEKEGMMDLIDVLDGPLSLATDLASAALPGANLLYKWGARLTGKLASWWKSRGNEELSSIEQLQPEQLLERLPRYLGIDICDGIKVKPKLRPMILLDTYEALWRDRGQKDGLADRRTDAWVRLLVQDAPGVLFVMAGRDNLRWGEIDEAWNSVIDAHLLGDLSDEDAERFLLDVPITEADVREKIVSSSNGLPFFLDLQVSQYEALREQDKIPVADQFGGTPSDILARFLEHLSEADQGALRLASYLQIITRPVMDDLAEAFPGRVINYSFDQMASRSSFVEISEGTYEIHALMKDELQRREKNEHEEQFKKTHKHLHQWFVKILPDLDEAIYQSKGLSEFENSFFHVEISNSEEAVTWLLNNLGYLEVRYAWKLIAELLEDALAIAEEIWTDNHLKSLIIINNLSVAYEHLGKIPESETLSRRFLNIATNYPEIPKFSVAVAKNNLAHSLQKHGELSEASALLCDALSIFEQTPKLNSLVLGGVASALAENLLRQGDLERAADLFVDTLKHFSNSPHAYAISIPLSLLAQSFLALGRHNVALPILFEAITSSTPDSFIDLGLPAMFAPEESDATSKNDHLGLDASEVLRFRWRSEFSELYYRKTRFEFFSTVLNADYRERVLNYRQVQQRTEPTASGNSRKYLERDIDQWASFKSHGNQELLSKFFHDEFLKFDYSRLLKKIIDHHNIPVLFFENEKFDVTYDGICHNILVTLPRGTDFLESFHHLSIAAEIRRIDLYISGHSPPDISDDIMKFAGFMHATNLALMESISSFIVERLETGLPMPNGLSEGALIFIDASRSNADREELYDIYAKQFEEC